MTYSISMMDKIKKALGVGKEEDKEEDKEYTDFRGGINSMVDESARWGDWKSPMKVISSEPNYATTLRASEPEVDFYGVSETDSIKEKEDSFKKAMSEMFSRRPGSTAILTTTPSSSGGGTSGFGIPTGGGGTGVVIGGFTGGLDIMSREPHGECAIPGCHKKADKHEDYGDFICEGHYATYKDSNRVETK